jgi:hypothetical protein
MNFGLKPIGWLASGPSHARGLSKTQMAAPIVLMLDGDVGFMLALSQELTARYISSYPACTVGEARSMLRRFRLAPDVLVIDCTVPGACSFAEGMVEQRRSLGILGIVSAGHQSEECAKLLAKTLHRPDDTSPERIPYCADVIQQVLRKELGHDGHVNAT